MNKKKFLAVLPVFKGDIKIIAEDQSMTDIVSEVLEAHKIYQADYDQLITVLKMPPDLYEWLFEFCKKNVVYEVETIDLQTTRSPAGILEMGSGDCKHYASFIAGILDALVRDGYAIDWRYRFAEYKNSASSHVFIVVKENGKEIWIDPVLSYFDQRYPAPTSFFDKKVKSMALHRLSGVEPEPTQETAFVNDTIVTREQYQRQVKVAEACAGSGSAMGLVDFPIGKDGDFFPGGDQSGGGGGSTPPPVVYPRPFEGVQYLVNGAPLVFPSKGSRALIPSDLVIVFPQTYQGHPLPVDLPKPVVAGNRLVLLPKIAWNVRDQYAAFDYLWIKFIQSALTPLIQSYGQFPDWNQENLYFTIWDDTDRADVVDYISSKPVAMSFDWELLPEIKYFAGAEPLAFGPDRNYNGNDFNGSHPPPIIPDTLSVVYPDFYKGVAVPDSLPRPIMNAGKLQLQPHGFGVDNMRANYFMWHSFLVAVMTPLIRSFAQYPYTGNNDLTERVWNDIAKNEHLENYLVAPDRKTFLGQVIETLAGYVQEVTRLSLKVINAGSRLAFLGLVRINAFAFAYKL
ncbi:MAG TPA: hypothetical protein VK609_07330, partial [Mucilaginibacter sp.]|nr:hypothetical protein [Mucilaginibacter sp.]